MFRFTIREMVLVTLMVALGFGWWMDRLRLDVRIEFLDDDANRTQLFFNEREGREVTLVVNGRSWPSGNPLPDLRTPIWRAAELPC